jgi:dihydrofolate synthase/folylpolyglutamate synthase
MMSELQVLTVAKGLPAWEELQAEQSFVEYLQQEAGVEKFRASFDLLKIQFAPLLDQLRSQLHCPVVTIAGTNGKGETAHSLAFLLQQQGKKVCLWTSPHILSIAERFVFLNKELTIDELQRLGKASSEWMKSHHVAYLSFYERLWLMFLLKLLEVGNQCDVLILEVGIGGRLDAVNMMDADLAVVTSISRDHQDLLGKTYASILREKLGIVRLGSKLVTAFSLSYLREKTRENLDPQQEWYDLFELMLIRHQDSFPKRNQLLAQFLFEQLYSSGLTSQSCVRPYPYFKGRGETWSFGKNDVVFFGSHNRDGLRQLFPLHPNQESPLHHQHFDQLWLSFSQRTDEEIEDLLELCLQAQKYYSIPMICGVGFTHLKAKQSQKLKSLFFKKMGEPLQWWADVTLLIQQQGLIFSGQGRPHRILVTGSYYFVGTVQRLLIEHTMLRDHQSCS